MDKKLLNNWVDSYTAAMYRTRALGVFAAAVMVLVVGLELCSIYIALSVAEVPFGQDLIESVTSHVSMLLFLAITFLTRIYCLIGYKADNYALPAATGLLSITVVILYIWMQAPGASPSGTTCTPTGQCFTIYDMARADRAALGCVMYAFFGGLRAVATAVYAALKYRYR